MCILVTIQIQWEFGGMKESFVCHTFHLFFNGVYLYQCNALVGINIGLQTCARGSQ